MGIPCYGCLKLPRCVDKELRILREKCKDFKIFTYKRKGTSKIIKDRDNFLCKLKIIDGRPKMYIDCSLLDPKKNK